jgi:hypothetical protein
LILHGAGAAWDQLSTDPMKSAAALIVFKELIIGSSVDPSLLGLIKWLKGKLVVEESPGPEPGEVTLKAEDGSQITVKPEVAGLNRDPQIRRKAREIVEPLRRPGMDTLEIRATPVSALRLEKDDVPAFEIPEVEDAEVLSEQEIDVYLDVLTAELEKGSTRKWRFGGLGATFWAPIEDAAFMEKFSHREQVLGVGDRLYAKVKIIQKRDPATSKIRFERQVMEVKEVIEAPEQLSLKERTDEIQRVLGSSSDDAENDDDRPALPA